MSFMEIMNKNNCPNCGAVIDKNNYKCSYCGTLYYDLSTIPLNEPFYLKIRLNDGRIITKRVVCANAEISMTPLSMDVYRNYNFRFQCLYNPGEETVGLDFKEVRVNKTVKEEKL